MIEVEEVPVAEKGLEGDRHRMRVLSGELPMISAEYVGLGNSWKLADQLCLP